MKVLPIGYITIKEVSARAHACVNTIRADIKRERLAVYRIPRKKPDLFREEDVKAYISVYHTPQLK
jgi:transposase